MHAVLTRHPHRETPLTSPKAPPVDAPGYKPRRAHLVIGILLLVLATIHCAASIFFVNYSYLDLKAYAAGTEKLPYQGRIGMMPFLQLAENSPKFTAIAAQIDETLRGHHKRSSFQNITPEVLACMVMALLSLAVSVTVAVFYGIKRFAALWWLPATLLLAMLYVTQGARYESALWYPYDLPHAALFGTACIFILEGAWIPALLIFFIDIPVRETSIFLVSVTLVVAWARNQRRQGLILAALMLAAWIPFRLYVGHRFAANPTETGIHISFILNTIIHPIQWPQTATAFGFLLVPLIFFNRLLSRTQRAFLLGAAPGILVTLAFGVWSETRIFGEWLLPAAVLLTAEAVAAIAAWLRNPQSPMHKYLASISS
jgi:hypothetical protein